MSTLTQRLHPTGSTMDAIKVFIAGVIGFSVEYFFWIPDVIKFIILVATCVYVVYKMMREIRRFHDGGDESGNGDKS